MSPVSRLKKTWGKVKTAKFDILEVCIVFMSIFFVVYVSSDGVISTVTFRMELSIRDNKSGK